MHVRHFPTLPNAEVVALMGRARAFVFPISWDEPFGLVVAEAMAAGTPVVATPRGSLPELVEHGVTGFLGETDEELAAYALRAGELDRAACRRRAETRTVRSAWCRTTRRCTARSCSRERFDFSAANLDREFPVRRHLLYFNHAAVAPLPRRVADAMTAHVANVRDRGAADWRRWYAAIEATRESGARFLGARAEEIAFLPNTSWGLNLVAAVLSVEAGRQRRVERHGVPLERLPLAEARASAGSSAASPAAARDG